MGGQQRLNGDHPPARRKTENYRMYEHGVAIADLASRTHTLEDDHKECDEWRKDMSTTVAALDKKLDRLLNRAWGVGKTLTVGTGMFVAACTACAFLADKLGMTIHFGG